MLSASSPVADLGSVAWGGKKNVMGALLRKLVNINVCYGSPGYCLVMVGLILYLHCSSRPIPSYKYYDSVIVTFKFQFINNSTFYLGPITVNLSSHLYYRYKRPTPYSYCVHCTIQGAVEPSHFSISLKFMQIANYQSQTI
jgi:hypothetical protein